MDKETSITKLNELLKGELMAAEIYEQTKGMQGDSQVQQMLDVFAGDHRKHARQLEERIQQLGGTPKEGMGFAGMMADVTSRINAMRGPKHLLDQIYAGEDQGVQAYRERITDVDESSQDLIEQIMAEDEEHLRLFAERTNEEQAENN